MKQSKSALQLTAYTAFCRLYKAGRITDSMLNMLRTTTQTVRTDEEGVVHGQVTFSHISNQDVQTVVITCRIMHRDSVAPHEHEWTPVTATLREWRRDTTFLWDAAEKEWKPEIRVVARAS